MANVLLSTKAVGSTVKLKVNGTAKEFIVVHQGKPSSLYDNSCDGTWLLMKDIYENRQWHNSNVNNLENSTIHSYLNGTFLNLFESNIRDAIKQVKLPYRKNGGSGGSDQSGAKRPLCQDFPAVRLRDWLHDQRQPLLPGRRCEAVLLRGRNRFVCAEQAHCVPERLGRPLVAPLPVHRQHQLRVVRHLQWRLLQRQRVQLVRHPPRFDSSLYTLGL